MKVIHADKLYEEAWLNKPNNQGYEKFYKWLETEFGCSIARPPHGSRFRAAPYAVVTPKFMEWFNQNKFTVKTSYKHCYETKNHLGDTVLVYEIP